MYKRWLTNYEDTEKYIVIIKGENSSEELNQIITDQILKKILSNHKWSEIFFMKTIFAWLPTHLLRGKALCHFSKFLYCLLSFKIKIFLSVLALYIEWVARIHLTSPWHGVSFYKDLHNPVVPWRLGPLDAHTVLWSESISSPMDSSPFYGYFLNNIFIYFLFCL